MHSGPGWASSSANYASDGTKRRAEGQGKVGKNKVIRAVGIRSTCQWRQLGIGGLCLCNCRWRFGSAAFLSLSSSISLLVLVPCASWRGTFAGDGGVLVGRGTLARVDRRRRRQCSGTADRGGSEGLAEDGGPPPWFGLLNCKQILTFCSIDYRSAPWVQGPRQHTDAAARCTRRRRE